MTEGGRERILQFHQMDKEINPCRVCVAGGSGRIGPSLVRKLLERGHIVHATVRNICDPEKTAPLKNLPGADTRLFLFEADLFEAHQFEEAIRGCEFVFLVAFPTRLIKGRDAREAVLTAQDSILAACERSGTVRRLIYTGSTTAASPLEEGGLRFRDFLDESCWTSLDLPVLRSHETPDILKFYIPLKTESERQLMNYAEHREGKTSVEVVILTCGVVGGEAIGNKTAGLGVLISPITGDAAGYGILKVLQDQMCSVPLVHLDDVCEAHLFCMDVPLSSGRRFLCATAYPSLWEILAYYRLHYPDLVAAEGPEEPPGSRRITGGSTRLRDMGFEYKYGVEETIEDSVQYAKKLGLLKRS